MMDGLPKTVRIGPHDIKFSEMSKSDADKLYGLFVPTEKAIKLNNEYCTGSEAVETVLHEMIHAIFNVSKLEAKHGEERIAGTVGVYLAQVFRDNPELIAWMQQTVKK